MRSRISIAAIFVAASATLSHGQIVLSELDSIRASDAVLDDQYGGQVAISGNTMLVGSRYNNEAGTDSGAVYIYDATTQAELLKITGSDSVSGDQFGTSIDVSGNIAIIGASANDANGKSNSGAAYLFDISTGQELFKLVAADGEIGDRFGISVAIDGDFALVGSVSNDEQGTSSGAAYLFDVTTGQQIRKFTASDTIAGDLFGRVAMSGEIAVVSAIGADDDRGAVYVFDVMSGTELFKLMASDADPQDQLGWSVDIWGTTIVAGTVSDDPAPGWSGSAYIFDAATGLQLHKLNSNFESRSFGSSVAISGTTALIGAANTDDGSRGAAFIFDTVSGSQRFKLVGTGLGRFANLGSSVAIGTEYAIVGAYNSEGPSGDRVGSVHLFDADAECAADIVQDGNLNFLDVSEFIGQFAAADPATDLNNDGMYNFLDVSAFINLMSSNCN